MKTRYVHIGLPKNLSTTLQRDFFDKHPQIYHLGIGVGSNVDYVNPEIASACENHFQYSKNFSYKKAKTSISNAFQKRFQYCENEDSLKTCGISLELLSFTFTPDQIEIEEKAKRVFNAFGKNTKIILIVRQQKNLIESLYKEAIKIGYYGSFQDYLNYIYYSRDRNFIFDFQYDYLYSIYADLFGKENIEILFIEDYRKPSGDLIYNGAYCLLTQKLSQILGIENLKLDLDHYNKPLSLVELKKMQDLNKENVHGIGNQAYSTGTNFHRLKDYFNNELGILIDENYLYKDARVKNLNIERAKSINQNDEQINFQYPEKIEEFLKKLFVESNQRLHKQLGIPLPKSYCEF